MTETQEALLILLIVYILLTIIISTVLLATELFIEKNMYFGCPEYIYNNSNLNVFGATLSFLFLFILIPFYYIFWFIYWIFHIGRKEN